MNEWNETKLGNIIEIKHGYAFLGKFFQTEPNGNILITPGNFNIGGGFKSDKFKYYNGQIPEEYVLSGGDIIVTMTDLSKEVDTLGYSAIVPVDKNRKYLHNQRIGLVIPKTNNINLNYINWLLRSPKYRWHVISSASGSTVSHTSPSRICDYVFDLPPLSEQKAIVDVLNSLEEKINLLQRQNKTLERLAQTLFRKWFIEEAKDEWVDCSLYDSIILVGGGTPNTAIEEYWNGDIPWLSGADITKNHKNFILTSEKKISNFGLQNSSAKLMPKNATIITARGTVGKYGILSTPMAFSQTNYGILPKYKNCFYFSYLLIDHSVSELLTAAYGSVFDTITTRTFMEFLINIPTEREIREFEEQITPIFDRMLLNQSQIRTLETLRDTLIPKLISGEVRVKAGN